MDFTYYDMSTRHLITRVSEHLDFNSIQSSTIEDHILSCGICSVVQHALKSRFNYDVMYVARNINI